MWLAVIPLFLIPACWAMLLASDLHPGIAIGRGAAWLLVGGCVLASLQAARRPAATAQPDAGWSPALIAALVLAWQVLTYLWHAPVLMPGAPWILERAAAAVCAWGLASWCAGRDLDGAARGLCGAGAVVLIVAALSDLFAPIAGVLGAEAPFGLSNFNVAAAMPLLGVGRLLLRRGRLSFSTAALVVLGWMALFIVALRLSHDGLGYHLHLHEGVRGAMVEALAMGGLAVLFLLPRDVHLPGVVLAALLLLGGEAYVVAGRVDTTAFAPSTLQRVFLWRSGCEAVMRAPLMGYGPGSAVAVLNQQPSFPAAWLSVPSYPEHAHQELLETLLDGGLINLALLGWLGWATLAPLWRRRERPIAQALLIGWAGFLSHAMLEVGLSQPGPVLMFSLLAGVSWAVGAAVTEPESTAPRRASTPAPALATLRQLLAAVAGLQVALALSVFLFGEMRGHLGRLAVGSVSELQLRAASVSERAAQDGNAGAQVKAIAQLRSLVGPLDILDYQQASLLQQISPGQLHQAVGLAIAQADRLPVLAVNLTLLMHLHQDCHRQNDAWDAEQIDLALERARARLPLVMAQVRANDKNSLAYLHLNLFLRGRPPHLAPPPPVLPPAP